MYVMLGDVGGPFALYGLVEFGSRCPSDQNQGLRSPTGLGLIRVPVSGSLCFFPVEWLSAVTAFWD